MTKKLIWRLKEQPTTESLRELVKDKILTNDEAREILFSSETEEARDKKSLESEIRFLRELIDKLSQNKSQLIEIIRDIKVPYYYTQYWYRPYQVWCDADTFSITNATNTTAKGSITISGNAFSDIKTF